MKIYFDRYFQFYMRSNQPWVEVEVEEPTRLSEVLARAGIPTPEIFLAVINGEAVDAREALISNQDKVKIYPPIGGG